MLQWLRYEKKLEKPSSKLQILAPALEPPKIYSQSMLGHNKIGISGLNKRKSMKESHSLTHMQHKPAI